MDNYSLCFHDLSIGYTEKGSEKCLARGLNGYLMRSALTCLTGLNGSGKSTLLRTMDGFQKPLRGSVLLNGINITAYPLKEIAQHISIVLTEKIPCEALTVFDIVSMGRLPYTGHFGKLSASDKAIVTNALEKVGLTAFSRRRFYELSDGERQKVLIAKAIAQETPIILLDEPTAYLDYPSKIAMMLLLHRLAKALKKTIFMSTHDLEHALQVADQVWLIDHEKGLTTGMPEDLSIDGSIERYFAKENMMFDRESCTFSIEYETARDIIVEGKEDTLEYRLCCKALLRNGMKPVSKTEESNASTDVTLKIPGDGTYRLIEKGRETVKVEKMAHLLHMIVPAITKYHISAIREAAEMNQYE